MRRLLVPLAFAAALASAVPAAADLRPIRRDFGELQLPRLRAGEIHVPAGHARGRITVLVRLAQPPLAAHQRTLSARGTRQKLNVSSPASRAYRARLAAAQRAAVAQLERAIPEATIGRRFVVLLNALTVELPVRQLPTLVRHPLATRVYPSLRYTLALNESPAMIGADTIAATTGARGDGVKIAIVDDGVDQSNPFFNPSGFQYPAGFPKGGTRWTTPKVIVARAFPGPGSGRGGRLAVDPQVSFHGTHVGGIAAGVAGTTATRGGDHPVVGGLSGVAPRAYLGNYRVFTVPTPIGNVANTPEIVAAFEAAVEDGMDVINFSGGGPQTEPVNDAMNETIRNVAAVGVVPVISAGNDRDEFGLGTAGSPGTAPDAISVAALSNTQVFAPALSARAPGAPASLAHVPFRRAVAPDTPASWSSADQRLVDAATVVGTDGRPVDPLLCGPPEDPNGGRGTLPAGSLTGVIVLASRGTCTFASKSERAAAAGAIGMVVVDNRSGEANFIPAQLAIPGGMVSDLDGNQLRAFMATTGGRTAIRVGGDVERIETGRGGVVTSFSSAGPTAFGHDLKPDVAAPGGQILSSTLPAAGGPFAVFDGTSMSAPHVSGAAAILVQRHPSWTTRQVKSALISTAGPAWADSARTVEAPVLLQGGGLINVSRADDPKVFTDPMSLSFDDLNVSRGARSEARLVLVADAGDGTGAWTVELRPQLASAGASIDLPASVDVAPGGEAELPVVVRASASAAPGDNFGFVVLRRGDLTRRVPYYFAVIRPALEPVPAVPLRTLQLGETTTGPSRVSQYRFPSAAFGPPPDYVGPPMREDGAERLYSLRLNEPAANLGAAVIEADGAQIDPWVLGSKSESDVQGSAGTPVDVNPLTLNYRLNIGAAGASLPRPKTYYVAVDAGRDIFTGRLGAGRYRLRAWVNDVFPPLIVPVTTRVAAGRPTLVVRVVDGVFGEPAAGVDPFSIVLSYQRVVVGAAAYDPASGLAIFPLPPAAPALPAGRTPLVAVGSDYQEAKNVNTSGADIMPNTSFRRIAVRVVDGPAATWLEPEARQCLAREQDLTVTAGSTAAVRSVEFFDGRRRIAVDRSATAQLYEATWRTQGAAPGRHVLRAIVRDASGRAATAERVVRVCR